MRAASPGVSLPSLHIPLPFVCLREIHFVRNFSPVKLRIFQEKCARFTHKISIISEFRFQSSVEPRNLAARYAQNNPANISKKFSNNRPIVQQPFAKTFQGFGPNVPRFGAKPWKDLWVWSYSSLPCRNHFGLIESFLKGFRRLSSRVSQSMFDTAFIFLNCKLKKL